MAAGTLGDEEPQVETQQRSGVLNSPITWLVGLVLVAGAVALGLAAGSSSDSPVSQTAFAETIGDPLPLFADPDPAIGIAVPRVSAQTLQGDRVNLVADGTARLYGFFAHWCPHCQAELPLTVEWLEANDLPEGVEMIAVSTGVDDTAANYPPSEWFDREDWPGMVLLDSTESELAAGFGLSAFPYWVAVDGEGKVVTRITGGIDDNDLEALVARLATGS